MKKNFHNPVAFRPLPVTIITSITYAALIVTLLVIHLVVPSAPNNPTAVVGTNLTEAWQDLQTLSSGFHPYNSRRNDQVRDWLLRRINTILESNGVLLPHVSDDRRYAVPGNGTAPKFTPVVVFSDMISNVTFSAAGRLTGSSSHRNPGLSVYFEGTNIIVYIRGSEDGDEDWWKTNKKPPAKGGVLVNAHYDSVSTGFGASDDGVGVITVLQLIRHFTTKGLRPKKGIVALLNNGEEDFLNGAWAFSQHSMSQFTHTFLNLEGAGAGGRATLFRSTDVEVTRFYQKSVYPFGSVVSADAFKRGVVRSQTDYVIFNGVLGLRGLDVAFMEPRARYHTDQDDARHTSVDSIYHMLSAALSTVGGLASDTSSTFDGESAGKGKVPSGKGTDGVWFDLFGRALAVFQLHTLFALSITLLVVAPLTLIVLGSILIKVDKFYFFSSSKHHHHAEGDDSVSLQGWKGIVRFPVIFIFSSAAVVGLAFLLTKINPFVVHSSPYAVWSMMISAWLFLAWFLSRAADFVRPTAFQRAYSLLWMFAATWLILVLVTVLEQRPKIAGGYFMFFYFSATFVATTISFLELFGLPRKSDYAEKVENEEEEAASPRTGSISSGPLLNSSTGEQPKRGLEQNGDEDEDATESTSLLRSGRQATFPHYSSAHANGDEDEQHESDGKEKHKVYGDEQAWSSSLPTWTWLLQFVILAPILIILVGQIALLFTSATYQTLEDGNSPLLVYVGIAVLSVLILAPLGPFLHRYTYHIPTFLLLVFIGTLIYNLVAFPFSPNNRLKLYFVQKVDLDTGINRVSLTGIGDPYLSEAIHSLPSSAGQKLECSKSGARRDLTECAWNGIPPRVVKNTHPGVPPEFGYADWINLNITRNSSRPRARFHLWGRNTRSCRINFNKPISDFNVVGASQDKRFKHVSEDGSRAILLWSRTWEKPWNVDVSWDIDERDGEGAAGLDGRVACLWSDDNETGVIPALDEVKHFAPDWVAVTKTDDGLVEGSKAFMA